MTINKKILLLIFVIVMMGIGLLIWFYPTVNCDQFSGIYNYNTQGYGSKIKECVNAGCKILKGKQFDNPRLMDDEGYEYSCVPQ